GHSLGLWDIRKRQISGFLPGGDPKEDLHDPRQISPDGRFLFVRDLSKDPGKFAKTTIWNLQDLAKPRVVSLIRAPSGALHFSPDSRTLVQFHTEKSQDIVFWETATGREIGRTPAPFKRLSSHVAFSSDSRLVAFNTGLFPEDRLAVADLVTGELLWSK